MINENIMQALLAPHISEKATRTVETANQHVFRVRLDADKPMIKRAVETMFGVKVLDVRVTRVKGKSKKSGRVQGRRSDWKKAYVKLEPGADIKLGEPE